MDVTVESLVTQQSLITWLQLKLSNVPHTIKVDSIDAGAKDTLGLKNFAGSSSTFDWIATDILLCMMTRASVLDSDLDIGECTSGCQPFELCMLATVILQQFHNCNGELCMYMYQYTLMAACTP